MLYYLCALLLILFVFDSYSIDCGSSTDNPVSIDERFFFCDSGETSGFTFLPSNAKLYRAEFLSNTWRILPGAIDTLNPWTSSDTRFIVARNNAEDLDSVFVETSTFQNPPLEIGYTNVEEIPSAEDIFFEVFASDTIEIDFTENISDGDTSSQDVWVVVMSQVSRGVLSLFGSAMIISSFPTYLERNQKLVYTPPSDSGDDEVSFRFSLDDGLQSSIEEWTCYIRIVSNSPEFTGETLSLDEDDVYILTLAALETFENVQYRVSALPSNAGLYQYTEEDEMGSFIGEQMSTASSVEDPMGRIVFLPDANFNGQTSFSIGANFESKVETTLGTFTAQVSAVQDPPESPESITVVVLEDTRTAITLEGSDIDDSSNNVSVIITQLPQRGNLFISLSSSDPLQLQAVTDLVLFYESSDLDMFGVGFDAFKYKAYIDGRVSLTETTVTVDVASVLDPVVADESSVHVNQDELSWIPVLFVSDIDEDLSSLVVNITTFPKYGTLNQIGNAPRSKGTTIDEASTTLQSGVFVFAYTPFPGFVAESSTEIEEIFFTVLRNGVVASNEGRVSITVDPVDDEGILQVVSFSASTNESESISIDLSASGGSPPFTFRIFSGSQRGTLREVDSVITSFPYTLLGSTVIFTPIQYESGSDYDSFMYTAADSLGEVSRFAATITISVIDDLIPPIALPLNVILDEDDSSLVIFRITNFEPQNNAYNITIVSVPDHGDLWQVNELGIAVDKIIESPVDVVDGAGTARLHRVRYFPDPNYNGNDEFSYFATNIVGTTSGFALVSIEVSPVNDPPVAEDVSASINNLIESSITINFNVTDMIDTGIADTKDHLTITIETAPMVGTIMDGFENILTDGALLNTGILSVTFNSPNDTSTFSSFTYFVSDESLRSETATVFITILPINFAPISFGDSVQTIEDVDRLILLQATDEEDNGMTMYISLFPSNGKLYQVTDIAGIGDLMNPTQGGAMVTDGAGTNLPHRVFYRPDPNFSSDIPDFFEFFAEDVDGGVSGRSIIEVTVIGVNDPPIAQSEITIDLNEDTPVTFSLTQYSSDGDSPLEELTFTINADVIAGILSVQCGSSIAVLIVVGTPYNLTDCVLSYSPELNDNGNSNFFTFELFDGEFTSEEARVTLKIAPVNDAPEAIDVFASTLEDVSITVTLNGTDVDGDPIRAVIESTPRNGILLTTSGDVINEGGVTNTLRRIQYQPDKDFNGIDSFQFKVRDNVIESENTATVTITIIPVDDPPVALGDNVMVLEDIPQVISFPFIDVDTFSGFFVIITKAPSNGKLFISNDPNQTKILESPSVSYPETQNLSYVSNLDYFGPDSIEYRVFDGFNESETGIIKITVQNVNDPPIAFDVSPIQILEDSTGVLITFAGLDVDGDTMYLIIDALPRNGVLLDSNRNRIVEGVQIFPRSAFYVPTANFFSPPNDTFTFQLADQSLYSSPKTVSIYVFPVNDIPVLCSSLLAIVNEDEPGVISICFDDIDNDVDQISAFVSSFPSPERATLFQYDMSELSESSPQITNKTETDGKTIFRMRFLAAKDKFGTDYASFSVYANDGEDDSVVSEISVTVVNQGDAPVVTSQLAVMDEDTQLTLFVNFTDVDGSLDVFDVRVTEFPNASISLFQFDETAAYQRGAQILERSNVANQDVIRDPLYRFIVVPEPNLSGISFTFTVTVKDSFDLQADGVYSITITPINDPPEVRDIAFEVTEDFPVIRFNLSDYTTDVDSFYLQYQLTSGTQRGKVQLDNKLVTIFPSEFFNGFIQYDGLDSSCVDGKTASSPQAAFNYYATDGMNISSVAQVVVRISCNIDDLFYINVWSCGGFCKPCPDGAICSEEGNHVPANQQGYWESEKDPFSFLTCFPRDSCPKSTFLSQQSSANDSISISSRTCAKGYKGRLCGDCENGYYRHSFYCEKCPQGLSASAVLMFVLLIILVFALVFVITFSDLDIGVLMITAVFVQTLILLDNYRQSDSAEDSSVSIYNLLSDMYAIACSFDATSFTNRWIGTMIAYVAVSSACIAFGIIARLLYMACLTHTRLEPYRGPLQRFTHTCRNTLVVWLSLSYLTYLPIALSPLDCTMKEDGSWSLDASPSEECYDDQWWEMSALYISGFLYFTVFLPVLQYYVLFVSRPPSFYTAECSSRCPWMRRPRDPLKMWQHRRAAEENLRIQRQLEPGNKRRLSHEPVYNKQFELWNRKYQAMTRTFHSIVFYWDLVGNTKKILLVIPQIFFTSFPMTQAILTTFLLVVFIFLHLYAQPYKSPTLNRLELATLLCIFFITVSTMLVYGDPGFKNHWLGLVFDSFTTIFVIVAFVFIVLLVFLFILKALYKKFTIVQKYVPDLLLLYMEEKEGEFEELRKLKLALESRPHHKSTIVSLEGNVDTKDLKKSQRTASIVLSGDLAEQKVEDEKTVINSEEPFTVIYSQDSEDDYSDFV